VPFSATDRVLLIGEGDFSFARALVRDEKLGIVPANVIATTLDQENELKEKYPETLEANVEELKQKGVFVLCNVDATKLEACKALRGRTFDKIVWNFPHVGKLLASSQCNSFANARCLQGRELRTRTVTFARTKRLSSASSTVSRASLRTAPCPPHGSESVAITMNETMSLCPKTKTAM